MSRPALIRSIRDRIFVIRGRRVMLDADLAELYGVTTFYLNKAAGRNLRRFPADFRFQLSPLEAKNLTFQFGMSSWGGRRRPPYAFTEQGVAMLSGILNSDRAVEVNIAIMRAFVKLRRMVAANKALARKLDELERKVEGHGSDIRKLFDAIRELMEGPEDPPRKIGFIPPS